MTFSIIARDPETGAFGIAVTSSSPCVGARCMHLRSNVGVVASQNVTDPRLGPAILDRIQAGATAEEALAAVLDGYETARYRQITVLDNRGGSAHHSGSGTLGTNRVVVGENAIAAGNLLSTEQVPEDMIRSFELSSGELEHRLQGALAQGEATGGELGEVRSCGLAVVHDVGWRVTDIRVDEADQPIQKMASILDLWMKERDDYKLRGINPDLAPSYGVPGDE
ncbi:DUF1028 domain-containing protein [Gulosibacter chungangensis]|uniref:DUF1028 domain-containing protein n=1 Tax=Gulosibacter chungangensis TaxID=979746 RepID=A0A7J5BFT1_9MICO|nr:DUF1028 domain-containing protein [Gulosibacter chungangensis]KAB1644958.1 DUF1028 domain-containing protein [Gulosibacter chungangensis]